MKHKMANIHNTGHDKVVGDNWGYTKDELNRMQWVVDGKKLGYKDFLAATDDGNATWRPMYQKELDDLYEFPLYTVENVPEENWTAEYRNIIRPRLYNDRKNGVQVFAHDISSMALRTVFCCTKDHKGLVDPKWAAQNTLVMKNNDSGQEFSMIDNSILEKNAVNGVITNAKVVGIDLSPDFSGDNGYTGLTLATVYILFNSVNVDDDGNGHDSLNEAMVNLVYVNTQDNEYNHGHWNVEGLAIQERIDASMYMVKATDQPAIDETRTVIYKGENHDYEERTLRSDVYGTEKYTK